MITDNWRIRTLEEKQQLRFKIIQLLQDSIPRTYKEIEQELGIKSVTFELDRLIHSREIVRIDLPEYGPYSYYKLNPPVPNIFLQGF